MEQLLHCLRAHIHTPNRKQLAKELRTLQGQLRAQGLEPALLHVLLFAFPDAVRELSHCWGFQRRGNELLVLVLGNVQRLDIERLHVFSVKRELSGKGHLSSPSFPAPPLIPKPTHQLAKGRRPSRPSQLKPHIYLKLSSLSGVHRPSPGEADSPPAPDSPTLDVRTGLAAQPGSTGSPGSAGYR